MELQKAQALTRIQSIEVKIEFMVSQSNYSIPVCDFNKPPMQTHRSCTGAKEKSCHQLSGLRPSPGLSDSRVTFSSINSLALRVAVRLQHLKMLLKIEFKHYPHKISAVDILGFLTRKERRTGLSTTQTDATRVTLLTKLRSWPGLL